MGLNKKYLLWVFLPLAMSLTVLSCTDLEDKVEDGFVEGGGSGGIDPQLLLNGVYAQLNGLTDQGNTYSLLEHPSDEMIGPTRGTDWSDFGVFRQLHLHTWDPSHSHILATWNQLNSGVFRATQTIDAAGGNAAIVAPARYLRGFFMFYLVDLFGQVPFREQTDDLTDNPRVMSRPEAVDFIIADLTAALPELPTIAEASPDAATQEAAHALLAKVYLNRAVYTAATASGPYDFSRDDMQQVVDHADAVIASPSLSLEPAGEYFDNFTPDNTTASNELIFVIENDPGNAPGNARNRYYMTLHYNQQPSGWNGFTTVADFYNKWDQDDERFRQSIPGVTDVSGLEAGFLEGLQEDQNGNPRVDRGGNPLVFTVDVDLLYSNERQGVRVIKYPPDYSNVDNPGNDYVFLRLADVVLMKAEALWRMGMTTEALDALNDVRTPRGVAAVTSIDANGTQILDERGFELYWEGWRRNDQIRFGTFLGTWAEKPEASPPHVVLYPIPQTALDTNPNLQQNPGY